MNQRPKCPIDLVIQMLANKWTVTIIRELIESPKRPSDLEKRLTGISAKTLSERLHDLQANGLISRQSFPEVPPRVVYSVTSLGLKLTDSLEALRDFGMHWQRHMEAEGYPHEICKDCPHGEAACNCPSPEELSVKTRKKQPQTVTLPAKS